MKKGIAICFVFFMGIIFYSCTGTLPVIKDNGNILSSTAWRLTKFNGKVIDSTTFSQTPQLKFWLDNRVTGNDGCNVIGGTYSLNNDRILFGPFTGTKIGCLNENYKNYNANMAKVEKFSLDKSTLTFYNGTTQLMEYTKK